MDISRYVFLEEEWNALSSPKNKNDVMDNILTKGNTIYYKQRTDFIDGLTTLWDRFILTNQTTIARLVETELRAN